ncbi:hypothetical protein JYK14_21435 [Siccirubricoccus sp. KC 17139]|uniref:DUF3040 domain-containing protein n=1 Tax=Siccirubricoccus soli TaxID=2899147 RepID=A0ABT1D9T7_9PROT|nr:hypothetical protein [Siccirubricoccus soli]MCO6418700.1 hypothetical protein [Siccirubricoccus soli]MCP2684835.1 hypothetical protein [Siccirubricoccus soli]
MESFRQPGPQNRDQRPPVLDMTPEGEFRDSLPPSGTGGWLDRALARLGGAALLVSLVTGGLLVAALAVLFVGLLLPVAIIGGLVAFGSLWWRLRRGGGRPVRFVVIRR